MKFYKLLVCVVLTTLSVMLTGCVNDNGIDNRETDYGHVQFKLYKEASYTPATEPKGRALVTQLDWLSQAYKVGVLMTYNVGNKKQNITVTLPL